MSIEDPGCLASAGILSTNYETPLFKGPDIKPSFELARRQVCAAPEDPGCLDHLNIMMNIEPPAPASVRHTPARTVELSTYEWGMRELANAELATYTQPAKPKQEERALTL